MYFAKFWDAELMCITHISSGRRERSILQEQTAKYIWHTYGSHYADGSGTQDQKFEPAATSIDLQPLLCPVPTSTLPVLRWK